MIERVIYHMNLEIIGYKGLSALVILDDQQYLLLSCSTAFGWTSKEFYINPVFQYDYISIITARRCKLNLRTYQFDRYSLLNFEPVCCIKKFNIFALVVLFQKLVNVLAQGGQKELNKK